MIANVGTLLASPYAQKFPRHLVLAQVYLKSHVLYRKIVDNMRKKGCRIILDTGAYENEPVSMLEYATVAQILRPPVLILPDIPNASWINSKRHGEKFARNCSHTPEKYIYIPQGQNMAQVLTAYDDAFQSLDAEKFIIGLGLGYKHWCETADDAAHERGRVEFVEDVMKVPGADLFKFHLLGGRKQPTKQFTRWTTSIVGLDAYDPCHCAMQDVIYPEYGDERYPQGCITEVTSDALLKENVENFCDLYGLNPGPDVDDDEPIYV